MIQKNSFKAWVMAARPATLGAMLCPVLIGSFLAFGENKFSWFWFFVVVTCALFLQILANLVNDYGDYIRGSDTKERLGPPRAMQMEWISERAMKYGITLVISLIVLLGLMLVMRGGLVILFTGIAALLVSIWYTAGPKPLSYLGFSEIAVLLFFGPLPLCGAYYIQTFSWNAQTLIASVGPAFLSTALIMTNNLRDVNQDRNHHKKTLAVRFGETASRYAIIFLVLLSSASAVILCMHYGFSWAILVTGLALIVPIMHFKLLFTPIGKHYNLMLKAIGKSLYLYAAFMVLGIFYGAS